MHLENSGDNPETNLVSALVDIQEAATRFLDDPFLAAYMGEIIGKAEFLVEAIEEKKEKGG